MKFNIEINISIIHKQLLWFELSALDVTDSYGGGGFPGCSCVLISNAFWCSCLSKK